LAAGRSPVPAHERKKQKRRPPPHCASREKKREVEDISLDSSLTSSHPNPVYF
jgi:hypothetical protein